MTGDGRNLLSFKQNEKAYFADAEDFETPENILSSMQKWVDNGFGHITIETVMNVYRDACAAENT